MELCTSVKGCTCHTCRDWIMPGRMYWKEHYQDYQVQKYRNYCAKCMVKVSKDNITDYLQLLKEAEQLRKKYDTLNKTICNTCKNKYLHVTGSCEPLKEGCRPKYNTTKFEVKHGDIKEGKKK